MADVTALCNQALAAVGTRTTISSIGEASNEARQCLIQFDTTRKQLLRAAHWGFARAYAKLIVLKARTGTPEAVRPPDYTIPPDGWDQALEPPPPWLYLYALPSGSLLIRYLLPKTATGAISPPLFGVTTNYSYPDEWMSPMIKFEMTEEGLVTNQPMAIACFTRDITDTAKFDPSFERAFVQGLAANMVTSITGDLKMLDALIKLTNSLILEARVRSANESLNVINTMPDWYSIRGAGPAIPSAPQMAEYGPLFGGVM